MLLDVRLNQHLTPGRREDSRRKLSQFVSYHILCYSDIRVVLAVVYLEDQADKVGQNRRCACLRLDRRRSLTGLWSHNWQPKCRSVENVRKHMS